MAKVAKVAKVEEQHFVCSKPTSDDAIPGDVDAISPRVLQALQASHARGRASDFRDFKLKRDGLSLTIGTQKDTSANEVRWLSFTIWEASSVATCIWRHRLGDGSQFPRLDSRYKMNVIRESLRDEEKNLGHGCLILNKY